MTAELDKPCQIKRDYQQLINLYPATDHTDAHYASKLRVYQQQIFKVNAQQKLLVLGQIGLGNGLEMLSWWHTQANLNQRLLLKVFEPNPINAYELKLLWDQSHTSMAVLGSELKLDSDFRFKFGTKLNPLAQSLLYAAPAAIIGCQRFIFDDGRITIDLHFGDIHTQLSSFTHSPQHPICHWLVLPHLQNLLHSQIYWQMAKLSDDNSTIAGVGLTETTLNSMKTCGFEVNDYSNTDDISFSKKPLNDHRDTVLLHERHVLRQQDAKVYAFNPTAPMLSSEISSPIAIIGGGLASAHLALSLAERGQGTQLFCKDAQLGQGASGNRQGAIYPLLTPEND